MRNCNRPFQHLLPFNLKINVMIVVSLAFNADIKKFIVINTERKEKKTRS